MSILTTLLEGGCVYDLVIVGAGPKAAAVGVRCAAMRSLGLPVPKILAVDPLGVGGHWRVEGGWTDGKQPLGTAPEKDLGFPYQPGDPELGDALFSYSWASYLRSTGKYDRWIDSGRPAPKHDDWAAYLTWAVERSEMPVLPARVERLEADADSWRVVVRGEGDLEEFSTRAVMVTGPGPAERRLAEAPGVWSLGDFWRRTPGLHNLRNPAVIGAGESAASVTARLVRAGVEDVVILAPCATVFSRGEGYLENRMYTHPEEWSVLSEEERMAVIERTDRGVFSPDNQAVVAQSGGVRFVRGAVGSVKELGDGLTVLSDEGEVLSQGHDVVVDARGGDPLWFLDLMGEAIRSKLPATDVEGLSRGVGHHLEFEGMYPRLLLPTLSGFRQGPGFANLSCLGTLGERVLEGLLQSTAG